MLAVARRCLKKSRLGVHFIPGFGTARILDEVLDIGVDVVRVGAHCTEANITRRHLTHVRTRGKKAIGVLMMSHMAEIPVLVEQSRQMQDYGAEAMVLMDSAGAYFPDEVARRVSALREALTIEVGFHGHNNLSLAVANSLAAAHAGATIIDGTSRGFGAGAGNTQLEVLVAALEKTGFETGVDLYAALDLADLTERELIRGEPQLQPKITSVSIVSGLAGVFSGYAKPVEAAAK
jgi:4-hydroxy 2-oxovalerate aldolase